LGYLFNGALSTHDFSIESAPKFFLAFGIDCGRWFLPTLVLPAVIPEATRRLVKV